MIIILVDAVNSLFVLSVVDNTCPYENLTADHMRLGFLITSAYKLPYTQFLSNLEVTFILIIEHALVEQSMDKAGHHIAFALSCDWLCLRKSMLILEVLTF